MVKLEFRISEGYGLHARPAGVLMQEAGKFGGTNITVINKDGTRASAKGLFGLLGLKIEGGDSVTVEIDGTNETEETAAVKAIQTLFDSNFKAPV